MPLECKITSLCFTNQNSIFPVLGLSLSSGRHQYILATRRYHYSPESGPNVGLLQYRIYAQLPPFPSSLRASLALTIRPGPKVLHPSLAPARKLSALAVSACAHPPLEEAARVWGPPISRQGIEATGPLQLGSWGFHTSQLQGGQPCLSQATCHSWLSVSPILRAEPACSSSNRTSFCAVSMFWNLIQTCSALVSPSVKWG